MAAILLSAAVFPAAARRGWRIGSVDGSADSVAYDTDPRHAKRDIDAYLPPPAQSATFELPAFAVAAQPAHIAALREHASDGQRQAVSGAARHRWRHRRVLNTDTTG